MTTATERPAVLKVEDLSVAYGAVRAVRGVSLALRQAECLGVVGANGAGKTSLLAGICGLVRPAGGSVSLDDVAIGGLKVEETVRRGLVLVPERRQLFASMSVRDNLLLGSYVLGRERKVPQQLERVEELFPTLARRREQRAGTLSGGEQQMLAIARGLMSTPRVLMVDEPSLGLAPVVVDAVVDALRELRRQGLTLLIVEQNVRLAMALADRLLVMEQGVVVRQTSADAVLDEEALVAAYLGGPTDPKAERHADDGGAGSREPSSDRSR
ncbi:MAG: ABC transporter ATP-binding protein [Actinomycetota bacterium]|nr:ABC transporter ATP-binding protein [Actinomycetota bacterium]